MGGLTPNSPALLNLLYCKLSSLQLDDTSAGKQQRQELRNRLGILIGHLLKWDYQPQLRGKSWKATIREQRDEIIDILESNPSLKPYLEEAIAKGFRQGINLVIRETPLDDQDLPIDCPYTVQQILDRSFPFE